MIDQIIELPEHGLKSSPETSHYTENKWISRKNQNKVYFLHLIDRKERLFKRLKNIEGKSEVLTIKDQGETQLREIRNINKNNTLKVIDEFRRKNNEVNKILFDIKKIDKTLHNAELVCTKTDGISIKTY